ncbi:hypothetical protein [Cellulomonas biazotea]|nr:hypothetical protein [Cellulomonas biazotea]
MHRPTRTLAALAVVVGRAACSPGSAAPDREPDVTAVQVVG